MNEENQQHERSQGNVQVEAIGSVISAAVDVLANENPDDDVAQERAHAFRYSLVQYINLAVGVTTDGTQMAVDGSGSPMGTVVEIGVAGNQLLRHTEELAMGVHAAGMHDELTQLRHAVAGLSVSIARAGAKIEVLEPVVEAFTVLAETTEEPERLTTLGYLMEEAISAINPTIASNTALRAMHLKWGSVATRSHDTELMQLAYDHMAKTIPGDLPAFFREAVAEMEEAGRPDDVKAMIQAYHDRQP